MAPKLALFLALSLLFAAAAQGCTSPYCGGPVIPNPPVVVPPPVVPTPSIPTGGYGKCPIDALKLKVCANVLGGLINVGLPEKEQCCPLLQGLVDLDAAVCLCTAIKANVLGIKLNVPVSLNLVLNKCGKYCPKDFTCPH
ncbi:hypothetical protein PR202_gb07394 [Eleusine coracana subsp. coracana]|uniref:Bifunctional inhibitor/plant lipid transfer protein/seed storage helical domain-containing protein n=1 Tax=Eleusine coracana subsp. coracana TaxID=191504 RepID=A0AAV5EBX9_ELECO|nr:hypothetical protein QOZ80_2BG0169810 [Eleusine coracana subsp. coracana]KAK3157085.1 hypothetical protein QOZ80_2AG0115960 [Eleusine coracana subsp. coracana]GJM91409.1 hypothetical protein PR202_ga07773 [Eleusine coracana subsp. coracana]GJN20067.1 hypothetical protein PR202_gb07394 [Eleusine coracana subsp. coracana]